MIGIRSALDLLIETGAVFEIRAITDSGISSGYYDSLEKAEADVLLLDADRTTTGIYVTLNAVNPDLLARRANRIKIRLSKKDSTTADSDIIRRRWFPIDIDPVRPSGVSSSEEEHENALAKADIIKEYLSELCWPDPICADSGNGAHLLYRIDLPNEPEIRDLIKDALNTLSVLFTDSKCVVDTANFNAARIWKLYGTVSRKGDNTPTRSHRRAAVTETPPEICAVTCDQIRSLATLLPKDEPVKQTRRRSSQPIDLGTWLDTHGLSYEQKPYADGTIFILDECPFSTAHKDGAFAIQFSSGGIFAGCHHNSCGSGSQRWQELREIYEGRRTNHQKPSPGGDGATTYNKKSDKRAILEQARAEPTDEENRIKAEALRILTEDDPVQYIVDTFAEDHIGDLTVAHCFTMSFASRSSVNSLGLHVSISGESGKGKSHAMSAMSSLLPPDLASTNRMSDKALFYKTDLKAGSAICLDDQGLSEQMQEILKGVTTSFKKEFKYDTVNKDRAGQTCTIPERCVWWVAKVEGVGDDQVWNRMLSCWIDDSIEQDYKVMENSLKTAASLPQFADGDRERVLICREIWNHLRSVYVVIPYAERIRFSDTRNRRNVDMLLDLVHARAAMMQYQRSTIEQAGYLCVAATVEDFRYAADLYSILTGESGGQLTKMTRKEAEMVSFIVHLNQSEFTVTDLQKVSGLSNSVINKMLQGYQSKGNIYSGLLEKCPAISYCDRTLVSGDEVEKTSRRSRAYQWDMHAYRKWVGIGTVWLEEEDQIDKNERHSGSERKLAEISATNREEMKPLLAESEGIEEDKILVAESGEIILEKKIRSSAEHIKPVTAIQNSAPSDVAPENPVNDSQNEKPSDYNAAASSAPKGYRSARMDTAASPTPPLSDDPPKPRSGFEVNPDDFKNLDVPIRGPCDRCNARYVEYIERITPGRLARKNEPSRRICKKCYKNAEKKKERSFRTLPGTLNTAGMERIFVDVGRCSVCNIGKAVWKDPENQISICDSCYANAGGSGTIPEESP
ncbi:MAG: hypothetical protein LUQ50_14375 [Methanospirillum sp.]|uniref:hypothetical protein n=1 Tax=Methanospirillum sp. TaxID=45200 RepID=UPI002370FB89|nr:hypothetical protein [Methanospirillum sp.]MDD1730240.1 hypothetical protein [Methanospirillum sp.]